MSGAVRAYVGLGANLDDPAAHVRRALLELDRLPGTRLAAASPLYRSPPLGPADQPDYVNAVARLETVLEPLALLHALQALEAAHGRVRGGERWGPRPLDLDLLLYGGAVIDTPRLTVPHPGLYDRAFVLYPLADIEPQLVFPDGRSLAQALARCPGDGLRRLGQ